MRMSRRNSKVEECSIKHQGKKKKRRKPMTMMTTLGHSQDKINNGIKVRTVIENLFSSKSRKSPKFRGECGDPITRNFYNPKWV